MLAPAPQPQAAVEVRRAGDARGDGQSLPRQARRSNGRADGQRDAQRVRDQRCSHPQQREVGAEERAAAEPGERGSGQTSSRQLAEHSTQCSPGEHHAAHALHGGAHQGGATRNGRQHDVHHVGGFERQWPTLAAAAESCGEGEDGHDTQDRGPVAQDVVRLIGRQRVVADQIAEPQQGAATEQRDEVHAVGGVEPLDVAEPAMLARTAHGVHGGNARRGWFRFDGGKGRRCVAHRASPSSAGRSASADHPDQLATYSRGGWKPACSIAMMLTHALTPEPQ
jgi:hypothetical protein